MRVDAKKKKEEKKRRLKMRENWNEMKRNEFPESSLGYKSGVGEYTKERGGAEILIRKGFMRCIVELKKFS